MHYVQCIVNLGLSESPTSIPHALNTSKKYRDEQQTEGLLLDLEEIKKENITDVENSAGSGSTLIEDHEHPASLEEQIKQV